jgi:hypothetical protein
MRFLGRQSCLLLLANLFRGNLCELVRAGLPNQYGYFFVCRLPAMLLFELLNGRVALCTSLTVSLQQFVSQITNLKTEIPATGITARLNFIAKIPHLVCQSVPVDFREVCPPLAQPRRLQCLPPIRNCTRTPPPPI